jgi:hypothetical protein
MSNPSRRLGMNKEQAGLVREKLETDNKVQYRTGVLAATTGMNCMSKFVVGEGEEKRPANTWWNDLHPHLKLTGFVEAWLFCAQSGLLNVLMPRVIGELEEMGDTDILDFLVEIGVIVATDSAPPSDQPDHQP